MREFSIGLVAAESMNGPSIGFPPSRERRGRGAESGISMSIRYRTPHLSQMAPFGQATSDTRS